MALGLLLLLSNQEGSLRRPQQQTPSERSLCHQPTDLSQDLNQVISDICTFSASSPPPIVSYITRLSALCWDCPITNVFVTRNWHDITTEGTWALKTEHGDGHHSGRRQSHSVRPEHSNSTVSSGSCLRTLILKPSGLCSL